MIYDFITIGGATRDISFFTNEGVLLDNSHDLLRQKLLAFEHGAKIKVDKFHYTYGGGGANTAVNFANFGFKTACLAAVGDDANGTEIIKNLKQKKVATQLISKLSGDSGFSFILIDQGERIIFTQRGVNNDLHINPVAEKFLASTKNIYISSLSGKWFANLKKIFTLATKKKIAVSWNPSQAQYQVGLKKLAPFLKKTQVFAVNKDEAIELAIMSSQKKLNAKFLQDEKNLLQIIKSFGPEIVVVTAGNAGAYVYDGTNFYHQEILKEKKHVDMTGVGDVFNSTFVAGLSLYKGDIKKALYLAARNTASKISHLGAQNGLLKLKK
ncbi:carbohydrate kinase family protein [Candidatus Falkowbacteria bacterium]|nr:carbohydrate kinase family protein [Candidatus Falkowbacteria bacterium]